ncbi:MAG TPA: aldo/keto reductase [Bryobacteraceae bacterium]|nr:aldo/keto reductase [Bryobacteraceae bacterium]
MEQRKLGSQGLAVSAIGLGCMGMSDFYGADASTEPESIATIQRALDLGVTLLDTGDFYGMGHNEMLIGRAIEGRREQAILSVKFGALRDHRGAFLGVDGRPAYVHTSLAYTLRRLGVDYVDLYYPSRVDPNVPIEETIGAIGDLIRQGKVRYAGLSEASAATVRRAHAALPISALQIEYSLWSRDPEDEVLPALRQLGIGLVAYGALSRGLFGGTMAATPGDARANFPRFQGDNLAANLKLMATLKQLAAERNVTPSQLALAWVLAQGGDVVPIIGTRRRAHLEENLSAADLQLTPGDVQRIQRAIPRGAVAGDRYPAPIMPTLNR